MKILFHVHITNRATRILLRKGGLEPKSIFCRKNVSIGLRVEQTGEPKRTTDGNLVAKPPAAGHFCDFSAKNSRFSAIQIKCHTCLKPFGRTKLLRFESQLKNYSKLPSPFKPPLLTCQGQNMFQR